MSGSDSESDRETHTRLNDGAGLEIAHEEDFGIYRDESGALQPVAQRIPGTDKAIRVKPLSAGKRTAYSDVLDRGDADAERIAQLWREHIVEGIGSDATPADIEGDDGIPYGLVGGINQALKNSSGEEVFLATRQQQNEEISANVELLELLGEENLEKLGELGASNAPPGANGSSTR